MPCCCVRRRGSSSSSPIRGSSNTRLKDAAMIATCCISFVAAFAVAMTTIARSGAKNLATSVSILGSIILLPPVLVSLCLSRFTASSAASHSHQHLQDEENAAGTVTDDFLELEQLWWSQFQEFPMEDVAVSQQELQDVSKLSCHGCLRLGNGSSMQEVLVRKLEFNKDKLTELEIEELKEEIVNLGRIRRYNVLPLLGFSLDRSRLLLFMPKLQSLTDVLTTSTLSWICRCRVAALTARGLSRLHYSGSTASEAGTGAGSILHGNIRSDTIHLLMEGTGDEICTPYIVDTGLLKLTSMPIFRVAEAATNSTSSAYSAPEYSSAGTLTTKADVYSFGVVLCVLLSGQTDVTNLNPVTMLKQKPKQLVDPKLGKLYSKSQAQRIHQAAVKCIQRDPLQRPDMISVEAMLRPLLLHTT